MPRRVTPFVDGEYYHCFNKTISGDGIFLNSNTVEVFCEIAWFYRSQKGNRRYSHFSRLNGSDRGDFVKILDNSRYFNADILAYSVMPNHFHFILKQSNNGSIESMMRNVLISFTRHYNTLNKRKGPLFLTQFKAVRILSQDQLLHTTRYVHLNHYSSGIISSIDKLTEVPSSYHVYIYGEKDLLVNYEFVTKVFGTNKEKYKNFVEKNAEYQKTLDYIKHTKKWNL